MSASDAFPNTLRNYQETFQNQFTKNNQKRKTKKDENLVEKHSVLTPRRENNQKIDIFVNSEKLKDSLTLGSAQDFYHSPLFSPSSHPVEPHRFLPPSPSLSLSSLNPSLASSPLDVARIRPAGRCSRRDKEGVRELLYGEEASKLSRCDLCLGPRASENIRAYGEQGGRELLRAHRSCLKEYWMRAAEEQGSVEMVPLPRVGGRRQEPLFFCEDLVRRGVVSREERNATLRKIQEKEGRV